MGFLVEGLRLWASMTMKLEKLAKLLAIPQRRERFIEKCLRHTTHVAYVPHFEREFEKLYDKRLFAVLCFLKAVHPVLPLLQASWDPTRYVHGHSGEDGQDDVEDDGFQVSTDALRDKMLVAYAFMIFTLDWYVARIASWSEGCDCHEADLLEERSKFKRRRWLHETSSRGASNPLHATCMRKGKRSASMAAGKCDTLLSDLGRSSS